MAKGIETLSKVAGATMGREGNYTIIGQRFGSPVILDLDGEEEVTYAAVIEFIHTASLVHDDIIDHALLRRGRTSVNQLWGNSRPVLLGDWIYTTAMKMALRHDSLEVIRRLCSATLRMTEGELLTLERLGSSTVGVDEYFQIIERKTADLFAAAASIPALIPPANPNASAALHRYGAALGRCFQLVDDMLDFSCAPVLIRVHYPRLLMAVWQINYNKQ